MKTQIRIPPNERLKVLEKYGGCCSYCGKSLTTKTLCLDSNNNELYPSCLRCKRRKGSKTIQQFRFHIRVQHDKLRSLNSKFTLCLDYGLVTDVTNDVLFHFEKLKQ